MLLAVSVIVALVFFVAFIVSVSSGQYDDTYTPSVRMLFDDELVKENTCQVSSEITSESKNKPINIKQK
ncbi:MAG: cbb3-type cytochrome oxidase maturation protein [Sediminicola sp.]|jgi:cbb3-type cytochrome oxidase maturation protein